MIARLVGFLLIGVVFCLAACQECGEVSQIELAAGDGVQVLKSGVPSSAVFKDARPAALSYLLRRENYEIVVDATPASYVASATIAIKSSDGKRSAMAALPTGEQACAAYTVESENSIRMTWWGGRGCESHQEIKFFVTSADGKTIADERIPFNLFHNGTYCAADGP